MATAGNSHLRDDYAVFTNLAVMGDLYKIIDFCSSTNGGGTRLRPVNSAVSANLHIVTDLNRADVWDLMADSTDLQVSESVRADHGSCM